jgi:general secretion pathway protein D
MKTTLPACLTFLLLAFAGVACAQVEPRTSEGLDDATISVSRLISIVAATSGKRFVIDPRVRADVTLVGQDPSSVGYADLLMILQVHGFAAVEGGGYVRVVPDAVVRALPVPVVSGDASRPDAEYVSKTIPVGTMPAAMLVPLLRPLVPQQGHLAAIPCGSNILIIVDTAANVGRIEAMVRAIDTGERYEPAPCPPPDLTPRARPERGA